MPAKARLLISAALGGALVLIPLATVTTLASADMAIAKDNGNAGGNGGGNKGGGGDRGKSADAKSNKANKGNGGKPSWAGGNKSATRSSGNGKDPLGIGKAWRELTGQEKQKPVRRATTPQRAKNTAPKTAIAPRSRPASKPEFAQSDQLKNLNAANASLQAYANASPNSQVGRIATYRAAYIEYLAALDDPAATDEDILRLEQIAEDRFLDASNGRDLTPKAREEFHELLRLDQPLPGEEVTSTGTDDDDPDNGVIIVSN